MITKEETTLLLRLERSLRREQYATNAEVEEIIDEQTLVLSLLDGARTRESIAIALRFDPLHAASHDARIGNAQDNLIDALWKKENCGEGCIEWKA